MIARSMVLLALCLAAPLALGAAKSPARLDLTIDSPEPGAIVGDPGGMAFISGRALAHFGQFQTFDIAFVIDVSDSTSAPSGADIDGDGIIGARRGGKWLGIFGQILQLSSTDRGDTVLAAEIAAVQTLLDQLDPRTTRVGIVGFSGDTDPFTPDAYTHIPLTTNYEKVRQSLDEILDTGPYGRTNMVSGVLTGTVELLGTQSAFSERREGSRRIMIFLTDGTPTLPFEQSPNQNARMAIQQAKKAARARIRIDTYAIGPEALDKPVVTVEMAHVTQGVFTPVRHPKDLRAIFEEVSFAEIEELRILNRTTEENAAYTIQNADGSFSALVAMREGWNTVEVHARATDGTEAERSLRLRFLPNAGLQPLSPRQLAQRNRLMENRLMDLKRRSLEITTERDDAVRRELVVEIDRERAEAERRRELMIEIEKERQDAQRRAERDREELALDPEED